jgi:hypothetical protein
VGHEALTWENAQGGWFTPNFVDSSGNKTGESLLVTAQILSQNDQGSSSQPAAGQVADIPGGQFPLTSSDYLPPGWQVETIQASDLLPFSDLGSVPAGGSVSFDIALTAHWGGADLGPLRVGGYDFTLTPTHHGQDG